MRSAVVSTGSGRSPTYTRQQPDAGTCSHADGKPAATPAATRWSRSVVLVVQTTWSRRLLVATGTDALHVTVTCSLARPDTRYALVPFSRTSYATVPPILTDAAAGTTPMRILPLYASSTLRCAVCAARAASGRVGSSSAQAASAAASASRAKRERRGCMGTTSGGVRRGGSAERWQVPRNTRQYTHSAGRAHGMVRRRGRRGRPLGRRVRACPRLRRGRASAP